MTFLYLFVMLYQGWAIFFTRGPLSIFFGPSFGAHFMNKLGLTSYIFLQIGLLSSQKVLRRPDKKPQWARFGPGPILHGI